MKKNFAASLRRLSTRIALGLALIVPALTTPTGTPSSSVAKTRRTMHRSMTSDA